MVDQDAVDTERLVAAIRGKVGIDSKSGDVVIGDDFGALGADGKLLAVLLGRLAAQLMGKRSDDRASVGEMTALTGLPSGTVAPTIRRIKSRRLVDQDSDKRYFVPRPKVIAACGVLTSSGGPK